MSLKSTVVRLCNITVRIIRAPKPSYFSANRNRDYMRTRLSLQRPQIGLSRAVPLGTTWRNDLNSTSVLLTCQFLNLGRYRYFATQFCKVGLCQRAVTDLRKRAVTLCHGWH